MSPASAPEYDPLSSPTSYTSAIMPPVPPAPAPAPAATPRPRSASGITVGGGEGEQRLIVVSNRLPVTISKDDEGVYHFKMSSGGLVSALSGCKKTMSFTWIGWPGKDVSGFFSQRGLWSASRCLQGGSGGAYCGSA